MELGWEASHKEFCSQAVGEERKVRDRGKARVAAGCDWLDEAINKQPFVGDLEKALGLKELCKKGGAKKKEVAANKEGNMKLCLLGSKRNDIVGVVKIVLY